MKPRYLLPLLLLSSSIGLGSDLIHSFKSPAFNGFGYSSHMMMTENVSRSRKQAIKDSIKMEAETARIAAQNTPLNNFINNLQARIYSQLAANLTDEIFNSSGASFGAFSLQGGATITWTRAGEFVTLYIVDPVTGTTTSIQVPVGTLGSGGGG
jgi:hypothetical protein